MQHTAVINSAQMHQTSRCSPAILRRGLLALFFVLLGSSLCFYFLGATLPVAHVWVDHSITGKLPKNLVPIGDRYQNTTDTLKQLWSRRAIFTLILILLFGAVIPVLKFFGSLVTCFLLLRYRRCNDKHVSGTHDSEQCRRCLQSARRLSSFLRSISRFQVVDAYANVYMVAFLNSRMIHTEALFGSRCFFLYCITSILSAQVLYAATCQTRLSASATPSTEPLIVRDLESEYPTITEVLPEARKRASVSSYVWPVWMVLLWCTFLYGAVGMTRYPVLGAYASLDGKRPYLDGSTLTLVQVLKSAWRNAPQLGPGSSAILHAADVAVYRTTLLLLLAVFPFVVPPIAFLVKLVAFRGCGVAAEILSDWSMPGVFALGVATSYVALGRVDGMATLIPGGERLPWTSGFLLCMLVGVCSLGLRTMPPSRGIVAFVTTACVAVMGLGGAYQRSQQYSGVKLSSLNERISSVLPLANHLTSTKSPVTIGDCHHFARAYPNHRTESCLEIGPLFNISTRGMEAAGMWFTGANSTSVDSVHFSLDPRRIEVLGGVTWRTLVAEIDATIPRMTMWLRVKECLSPDVWFSKKCRTIWDNDRACCTRPDKALAFKLRIGVACVDEAPYFRSVFVKSFVLSKLVVHEPIGAFEVELDVTGRVEELVERVIGEQLREYESIMLSALNHVAQLNSSPSGFACEHLA
eukprot:Polyplicarium_translucidae@DN437_c0_g1_i1.p1